MNPYEVLGLSSQATKEEIKRKYRELAKKYHPDSPNGDAKKFDELQKAMKAIEEGNVSVFLERGVYIHKSAFTVVGRS